MSLWGSRFGFVFARRAQAYIKSKTAGGRPATGYFLLLRQKKVTKEKATPVRRPFGVPSLSRKRAGLRNSPW
jgi:hypothetical protein